MNNKLLTLGLAIVVGTSVSSCSNDNASSQVSLGPPASGLHATSRGTGGVYNVAAHVESITDKLYSSPSGMFKQFSEPHDINTQSCEMRDTGVLTIYTTNGMAEGEIDVKLDGVPVGRLSTYFPDGGPACKSPNAKGVITLMVPRGKHTINASSVNLNWPGHTFTINKCSCMLLPLS